LYKDIIIFDLPKEVVRSFRGGNRKGGLKMKTIISTIFLVLATISPAFAAETVVVYKSGLLVVAFVGICALIVVAQMVPALILLMGFIKALVTGHGKETPAVKSTN
jgi:hypothetical protein